MTFSFANAATALAQQHGRPPPIQVVAPPTTPTSTQTASRDVTYFTSNVCLKFPTKLHSNLRDRAATLFATLQVIDPSLQVLPLNDHSLNPLLSGPSFPTDVNNFYKYFSKPTHVACHIKTHVQLQSSIRIKLLKNNSFIREYLTKSGI